MAEAQPLLDGALGGPEAGGDVGDGDAGQRERPEGLDLVRRVHGDADHVLGERQLTVDGAVGDDAAGDGMVGLDDALACELVHCGEAPGAGDDGEALAAVLARLGGARHEVLDQAVGGDGSLELVEGGLAGGRLADIGGRGLEPVERDGSDDGFGHRLLRRWAAIGRHVDGTGGRVQPRGHQEDSRALSPTPGTLGRTPPGSISPRGGAGGREPAISRCRGSRGSRRRRSLRKRPQPRRTGRGG